MTNYSKYAGSIVEPASYITFYEYLMEYQVIMPFLMLMSYVEV